MSIYGAGGNGMGYQPFAVGGGAKGRMSHAGYDEKSSSMTMGLTDKEIDERVRCFAFLVTLNIDLSI